MYKSSFSHPYGLFTPETSSSFSMMGAFINMHENDGVNMSAFPLLFFFHKYQSILNNTSDHVICFHMLRLIFFYQKQSNIAQTLPPTCSHWTPLCEFYQRGKSIDQSCTKQMYQLKILAQLFEESLVGAPSDIIALVTRRRPWMR